MHIYKTYGTVEVVILAARPNRVGASMNKRQLPQIKS